MSGNIRLYNTNGYVELQAPSSATNQTLVLPTDSIQPGLVHLHTETFSAVSSVSIDNVFTSAYDKYFLSFDGDGSAASFLRFYFRASGANLNGSTDYKIGAIYFSTVNTAVSSSTANSTGSSFGTLGVLGTGVSGIDVKLFNPISSFTKITYGISVRTFSGTVENWQGFSSYAPSTQCDGISLFPSSGSMTGTLRIYGYRNS